MRVLVADDETSVRKFVNFVVTKHCPGVSIVGEASNGKQAIAQGLSLHPDVLLTDIRMPEVDGIAAAKQLKRQLPHLQIVFLTAYEEFDYAREAVALKAQNYLVKPVRVDELKGVLQQCADNLRKRELGNSLVLTMTSIVRETQPYLRSYLMGQLLNGDITNRGYKRLIQIIGSQLCPSFLVVLKSEYVLTEHGCLWHALQALCKSNREIITSSPTKGGAVLLVRTHAERGSTEDAMWIRQWAEGIRSDLETRLKTRITIGVGGVAQNASDIPRSYHQAQLALSFEFILGRGNVITLRDIISDRPENLYLLPLESELAGSIQNGSCEKALHHLERLLKKIESIAHRSPEVARQFLQNLVHIIVGAAEEQGAKDLNLLDDYVSRVKLANTFSQAAQELKQLTSSVVSISQSRKQEGNLDAIRRAISFVESNYDKKLTLESVAKNVYLSPCYFSRLFKKETGVNFARYVSLVRINTAKKLLLERRLSIKEVAGKVGYNDPRYFSYTFKKLTGILPSEYK
ncbi:response regulator [Gelria sp. Kuro-4]|uniref:response regulator n=1 Tax=Gelria sp. Kuro-4 TaxID=2796927 RepID=UPI001BF168D4|nr:response regulator [Gelria sp. Kuro-4]BCV24871.1 AraC family transcriptional regulator [Gelria sp. Kuro-4]